MLTRGNNGLSGKDILINPVLQMSPELRKLAGRKPAPTETPSNIVAPKTFKFDSSTDLKKELESINPEILENDFE